MSRSLLSVIKSKKLQPYDTLYTKKLLRAVDKDVGLQAAQKSTVLGLLKDESFLEKLKYGAPGAGIMYLISKYLNLSTSAQMLLSIAGYGIGRILYEWTNNPNNFMKYDKVNKVYELQV